MTDPESARGAGGLRTAPWRQHRFTVLLAFLLLHLLAAPIVVSSGGPGSSPLGLGVMAVAFTALTAAAVLATSRSRASLRVALGIGLVAVGTAWLGFATDRREVFAVARAAELVFLGYVVVLLVRHVFARRRITSDTISASLCAYLFVGLAWSSGYALIELAEPGSFRLPDGEAALGGEDGPEPPGEGGPGPRPSAAFAGRDIDASVRRIYFSFVTLLTLGYGDIVPTGAVARVAAAIEAFVGQLFLVVLVARLVGIQVAQAEPGPGRLDAG